MHYRTEHDSLGEIQVPEDRLWGAQTERSRHNFQIGESEREKMPLELIHSYAQIKRACAVANKRLGLLDDHIAELIIQACNEIIDGQLDEHFPLSIWQTGSGTQTNMNLNEVIARRAIQLDGSADNSLPFIHPNDHVNKSQSSNDTFPSAMHIATVEALETSLLPSIGELIDTLEEKAQIYADLIKIGRTHLQDATPLTLGQEISGWTAMMQSSRQQILLAMKQLYPLAIGGTAVGTGLNAPDNFGEAVAQELAEYTGRPFIQTQNTFHGLTSHDQLVFTSGALKGLAANLMKIANDVRWLASGPRCGIGELSIPANEPGSSIMPGKVNPTQAEAVSMVACQIMGNDAAIGFAASQGNFELNVFKPVIIANILRSITLLSDSMISFARNCLAGLEANQSVIEQYPSNSLMLVTALVPHIGYEQAARIAHKAHHDGSSLKEAATELGIIKAEEFDKLVKPEKMLPGRQ